MVKKTVLFLFLLGTALGQAFSANRFSRPDGTWSTTNGGVNCGCTPGQNDDIFVNHDITLAGPFILNTGSFTINSPATLTISGDVTFNNGSVVLVNLGGGLQINGNLLNKNNSNDISILGNISITGDFTNGTGSGAGAIIDFGPSATVSIGGSCTNNGTVSDGSGSYTGCGQGVLPIKLLFFKAKLEGKIVVLQWATSLEENFDRFVIERSQTGIAFEAIGELQGLGRNTYDVETNYSLQDNAPLLGFNYYRLKAIDLDGHSEYFDVRAVKIAGVKEISIYPNPTSGKSLSFGINFNPSENDQVLIVNNLGIELARLPVNKTENNIDFSSELASGVYMLKYISSNFELTSRLMVNR